ncbi:MAG: hypothetical protein K8F52_10060 [Candidatus Scalindua rubra]|uniref:Uncharacterized protein n=1 Tax=Candidatus Scalindua brodae TaxID=237368 RepID=A0A0B0EQ25_9BACT|nr:MAG: hypothetical protein SCABRO_00290 [Candidatus Scalindua brodae]MBZ0109002.1 hypothetical protein [Candidatus Scalindua rubra]
MGIDVDKDELYGLIKEAVREVIHEETLEFFFKNIPLVSKEEMKDIEKLYGKPSTNKEVVYSENVEI